MVLFQYLLKYSTQCTQFRTELHLHSSQVQILTTNKVKKLQHSKQWLTRPRPSQQSNPQDQDETKLSKYISILNAKTVFWEFPPLPGNTPVGNHMPHLLVITQYKKFHLYTFHRHSTVNFCKLNHLLYSSFVILFASAPFCKLVILSVVSIVSSSGSG